MTERQRYLIGQDDTQINHHQRITSGRLGRAAVRDVDAAAVAVVDVGGAAAGRGVHHLAALHDALLALVQDPDVLERRLVAPALEADEDVRAADGAVVQVGREVGRRRLQALEVLGHLQPRRESSCQVWSKTNWKRRDAELIDVNIRAPVNFFQRY